MSRLASLFFLSAHQSPDRADVLDGLRGLAVLIVLLSHLSNAGMSLFPGVNLAGTGKSGVYLFFVLSAFLLTRTLAARPVADFFAPRLWGNYLLRRVLRIWPLYLTVLVLSAALSLRLPNVPWHYRIDAAAFWAHIQLQAGQSVLWSIPVEFKYYAVLPFVALAFAALRHRRLKGGFDALLWLLGIGLASWLWPAQSSVGNDINLGPYLPVFFCGAFAAAWQVRMRACGQILSARSATVMAMIAMVAWVATMPSIWSSIQGLQSDPTVNHRWFLFFGLLWSLLLLAVVDGPGWLRWIFCTRALRLLGVVSFSAYLWHMPVLDAITKIGWRESWLAPWLFLGATLLASCLSFLIFERPFRELRLAKN